MAKSTRAMRYEIDTIVNEGIDWKTFVKELYQLQDAVWKTKNIAVQMVWDFQNFKVSYKERFGKFPKLEDLTGKKAQSSDIYDQVKDAFPNAPNDILTCAIREAESRFKALRGDIKHGEATIPTYKKDTPIPVRAKAIKLFKQDGKYMIDMQLLAKEYAKHNNLPTRYTVRVKTGGSAKAIFDRLLSGEYKLCDSEILRKKKKWYVSLRYSFEVQPKQLDKSKVMGVDMGVVNAAVLAFNDSFERYYISGSEISEFRRRIERRRIELQRQGKFCGEGRRGHGRKTRLKPIAKLQDKIANFRATTNHKYAKFIVQKAIQHGCGVIQLEKLDGISENNTFLKRWPYYDLQQKIKYKAEAAGIEVRMIDPKYTSQRCSKCGHIAEGNRPTQAEFHCQQCGFKTNADYNAARNIATPGIEKIIESKLEANKAALLAMD